MHVCLLPTEILMDIFALLLYDTSTSDTLAALARTCRTFKEPALDTLWENINGFEPLISCLPEGVSSMEQGKLTLQRPLLIGEWRIISQYAQRIRFLDVSSTELDIIDDRVVQALISAPSPAPLLPNLRGLVWLDDRECFFPLLRTLIVSTITSINLGFGSNSPTFAKSALFASLGARCPSIQELNCIYNGDSEESSDAISEALCGLLELVRLETGILNAQALLHLASLPLLKSLHFSVNTNDIDEMQPNSTPTFSSQLDQVHITAPSPPVLTYCLDNVRFLSCRSAILCVDHDYSNLQMLYDPLDIPELIVSFSECFCHTLEELHFIFEFEFDSLFDDALTDPSFALGFDVIAPLLSFSHLTDLRLDWMCTSAIDDASLKTMAQSWPQLEKFWFGCAARWLIPPSITFIGLAHLIHHCPRLCHIEMPFSAYPIDDIDSEPFFKTIPNGKITEIDVGISPIVDPIAVACQLHMLLP
ncbi:uncharacterized protein EDB91DRAFT_1030907, partial [Suillus paluster]|uniref:uncharacterized protein n=1 Tax=Suillus paluster TaxID=48578 RepID=UPI001B885B17